MSVDVDAQALCSLVDEEQNSLHLQMQVNQFSLNVGPEVTKLIERLLEQIRHNQIGSTPEKCWTRVLAYGSSGLHASIEGSDIDLYVGIALCAPSFTASHFFYGLPSLLKDVATELNVIRSARVPVIKFVYRGIHVDLIYASTDLDTAPSLTDMESDGFLLHVLVDNRFNVNGVRTVRQIERLVKVPLAHYQCVLRAVKRWAVRRGIYHNKFAYPNGVVLAILVAHVCQADPSLQTSQLLKLFFLRLTQMMLAGSGGASFGMAPVYITDAIEDGADRPVIDGMRPSWSPTRAQSLEELFPVINPAYPYVNSGHAVGRSGFIHVANEAQRAAHLLHRSGMPFSDALTQLWRPYAMTTDYTLFVAVEVQCVAASAAACQQDFEVWRGYVESRVRMLLYALECLFDTRPHPAMLGITAHQEPTTQHYHKSGSYYVGIRPQISSAPGRDGPSMTDDQRHHVDKQVLHAMREFRAALAESGSGQSFDRNHSTMLDPVYRLMQWPKDTLPRELLQ